MHFIANVSVFCQEAHNTCFSGDSDSKESTCNAADLDLIPGLGRTPGRGHGNPL